VRHTFIYSNKTWEDVIGVPNARIKRESYG